MKASVEDSGYLFVKVTTFDCGRDNQRRTKLWPCRSTRDLIPWFSSSGFLVWIANGVSRNVSGIVTLHDDETRKNERTKLHRIHMLKWYYRYYVLLAWDRIAKAQNIPVAGV